VSEGSYFIQNALAAAREQIVYDRISPTDWPADGSPPRNGEGLFYEIVIFDRWSPPTSPPGASLYVDALPPDAGVTAGTDGDFIYVPMVIDWDRVHAFTSGLTLLDRLEISRSRNWTFAPGWKTVMEGQGWVLADPADMMDDEKSAAAPERSAPLLVSRVDEERRIGVVAFNPTDSQWPMRVSFPLFVRNAVLWLARPGGLRRAEALRTGDTIQMDLEAPVASARVTFPSGREFPAFVAAGGRNVSFSETHELGVYRVAAGDVRRSCLR
jgi:hypothetical protein